MDNNVEVRVEALAVDALYSAQTKALPKKPLEPEATVMKDWEESTARVAPYAIIGCKASFADFETGRPVQKFVEVLNGLVAKGVVHSFYMEPSRSPIHMETWKEPLTKPAPPVDGYALFCMVHMLPEDFMNQKNSVKFLLAEGEALPSWKVGA